jgi:hypothetical protein
VNNGERKGAPSSLKVQGGLLLATVVLGLIDFIFWRVPTIIPYRRAKRSAGRMVFKIRD